MTSLVLNNRTLIATLKQHGVVLRLHTLVYITENVC